MRCKTYMMPLIFVYVFGCAESTPQPPEPATAQAQEREQEPAQPETIWQHAANQIIPLAEAALEELPDPDEAGLQGDQRRNAQYLIGSWRFAHETANYWAEREEQPTHEPQILTYAEVFYRVDRVLTENERQYLLLHGDLAALQHHEGNCTELMGWPGPGPWLGGTLMAYIDTETEQLVFLWVAPEG